MPDSSKREREPVSPLELVTSAFEIVAGSGRAGDDPEPEAAPPAASGSGVEEAGGGAARRRGGRRGADQ